MQRQSSTFKQTNSDGVSRLVSRPNFASLGLEGFRSRLGLEGFRSRGFEYFKEMVYWWLRHFLKKIRENARILKSRVSVSNFKSRVSVSEFLMKSQSRSRLEILTRSRSRSWRLRSQLHHCKRSKQFQWIWETLISTVTCSPKLKRKLRRSSKENHQFQSKPAWGKMTTSKSINMLKCRKI